MRLLAIAHNACTRTCMHAPEPPRAWPMTLHHDSWAVISCRQRLPQHWCQSRARAGSALIERLALPFSYSRLARPSSRAARAARHRWRAAALQADCMHHATTPKQRPRGRRVCVCVAARCEPGECIRGSTHHLQLVAMLLWADAPVSVARASSMECALPSSSTAIMTDSGHYHPAGRASGWLLHHVDCCLPWSGRWESASAGERPRLCIC